MKSKRRIYITTIVIGVLYGVVSFLLEAAQWFKTTWDDINFATVVYQLKTPLQGTNKDIIIDFCMKVIPQTMVKTVVIVVIYHFIMTFYEKYFIKIKIKIFTKILIINMGRKTKNILQLCFLICLIFLSVKGLTQKVKELGIDSYVKSVMESSSIFENNYVSPELVNIKFPENKRNLVFIYLESMETTYASVEDGGAKEENYIPELTKLAQEYVSVSNNEKMGGIYPCALTGWTMAALLGSTSGVPYKIPGDGNSAERYAEFLPGLTTLGDILSQNGYKNYFMCGSDAVFGGRKVYFESHGNYEIRDYNYAVEKGLLPKDYYEFWGYEDEKLFEFAKQELTEIASNDENFNFTMLTVDTHHNNGYVCRLCEDNYEEQYANVIACSSKQIYNFVTWIQEQEWYKNTTIVLLGDHNSMTSDFWDDIGDYTRRTYNCFINLPKDTNVSNVKNRECTTLDIFPTTLAAIGVEIEGDRLALGTNVFSDKKTLPEELGIDFFDGELYKYSKYYNDEFVGK